MEVQIRPFRLHDQPGARQIVLEGLKEHFGTLDLSLNGDLNNIVRSYLQEGHDFIVAELSGRVIGTGALVKETQDTGRIVRLSVAKAFRGFGVGKALVTHLLTLARQRSFHQLLVETNHDWHAAKALYQGFGFKEYSADTFSVHMKLQLV